QELRPDEYQPVEERTVEVGFKDKLIVARNGVVVSEGDSWKPLGVGVKVGGARPGVGSKKRAEKKAATKDGEAAGSDAAKAPAGGKRKGKGGKGTHGKRRGRKGSR
ncbi:MAG: hypothetical protein V3T05_10755, partial [Myxococcota bacterium]